MKQRELAKKLGKHDSMLENKRSKLKELKEHKEAIILKIRGAKEETEIKALDLEAEEISDEIKSIELEVKDAEKVVKDLETELEEAQNIDAGEEAERMKDNKIIIVGADESKEVAQRSAVGLYIRSKGTAERAGFTSVDGDAIIPKNTVTTPKVELGKEELNLGALISTVPVTTASGSHPILKKTDAILSTVAELAKNPELTNPSFIEVDYKIETYRGAIPISQEAIDDSSVDLVALVETHVDRMSVNTDNKAIATILKTFTKKVITTVDELKSIKNVDLDPAYKKEFVLSQSFYQLVDTLKDENGRYLFQESLTSPSGYVFMGITAYVARDTQLGTAGKATAFLGDLKEAVAKFDRKQIGVRWSDHSIYGQILQAGKRMNIKKVDANSGFYITAESLTVGPLPVQIP